jgi:hypothetical protein
MLTVQVSFSIKKGGYMPGDYIPKNVHHFHRLANNVVLVVREYITTWTHIPTEVFEDLKESLNILTSEIENTPEVSTKAQRNRRVTARRNCEKLLRSFVKHYLRNPFVTDDFLIKMGLTPHDTNRSPRIDVSETVDFVLHTKGIKNVIVDFWQTGSKSKT